MDAQSKIGRTLLIGLALGAALGVLLFYLKQVEKGEMASDESVQPAARAADEWSEMNDSLGG
jgi:hypothetical protein